jgi:hypothetical protein
MNRRARLLRFLAPWTARDGGYEIRVGSARLSAEVLSDDALKDLAARVVADFWAYRRRVRLNRPAYAAAALASGHRLPPETMAFAAALLGAGTTIAA